MTRLTLAVWVSPPPWAVTTTVYVPAGVPAAGVGEPLPPDWVGGGVAATPLNPPHPTSVRASTAQSVASNNGLFQLRLRASPAAPPRQTIPKNGSVKAKKVADAPRRSGLPFKADEVRGVVLMVNVVFAGPFEGTNELGVKEQAAPVGKPEHVKATVCVKPPVGVSVAVDVADCPAA